MFTSSIMQSMRPKFFLSPFFVMLLISLISYSLPSMAEEASAHRLSIAVNNVNTELGGSLYIGVCDSVKSCKPNAEPQALVAILKAPPVSESFNFSFPNIPSGDYAVIVFHDSNDNGKIDTKGVKILEGFAGSGEFKLNPSFRKLKFSLVEDKNVDLNIKYPKKLIASSD